MFNSIERRTFNSIIVGTISFSIIFVQNILIIPIFLTYWGKERYGLWLSMMALYSLMQAIDTGHQTYVGNEICKLYHTNIYKLREVVASSIKIAILIGIVEVVITFCLVTSSLLRQIIDFPKLFSDQQDVEIGLIILVVSWIFYGSVGGVLVRLYLPSGLYSKSLWLGIGLRFSQTLSVIAVIVAGGGILAACVVSSLVQIFLSILIIKDLCETFNWVYPFWVGGNWKTGWGNLRNSLIITIAGILLQLQSNGITLIVSSLLGTATAPVFTTMRTLSNTFVQGTTIVTQPLTPEIVRYHAQGEYQKLIGVIEASWWFSGILINFSIIGTLPFVEQIYIHWTRGKIGFDWMLYLLLAWSISLKNFGNPLNTYLAGINHLQAQSIMTVTQTTTVLGGTFLFLSQGGIVAAGWAVVAGEIFGSVFLPIKFTIKEIDKLGGKLPISQLTLALTSVLGVGIVFIGLALGYLTPILAAIIGFVILLIVYIIQWINLPYEVQKRLVGLYKSLGFIKH